MRPFAPMMVAGASPVAAAAASPPGRGPPMRYALALSTSGLSTDASPFAATDALVHVDEGFSGCWVNALAVETSAGTSARMTPNRAIESVVRLTHYGYSPDEDFKASGARRYNPTPSLSKKEKNQLLGTERISPGNRNS